MGFICALGIGELCVYCRLGNGVGAVAYVAKDAVDA